MNNSSPLFSNGNEKYSAREACAVILLFLLVLIIGFIAPILIQSNSLYSVKLLYDYRPGELANEDVVAPYDFSFEDTIATQEAREKNASRVLPRFSFSYAKSQGTKSRVKSMVQALASGGSALTDELSSYENVETNALANSWALLDEEEQHLIILILEDSVDYFLYNGIFSAAELADIERDGYKLVYATLPASYDYTLAARMGYTSNLISDGNLSEKLLDFLQDYNISLTPSGYSILFDLVNLIVEPNVGYDALETEKLRDEARANTPVVLAEIHKGDYILRYDTIITEQALQTIQRINGIKIDVSIPQIIAQIFFLAIILYVSLSFISYFTERKYRVLTYTLIFLITLIIVLVFSALSAFFFSPVREARNQLLPFLLLPLFMCQLSNKKRVGFVCGTVYACFVLFFPSTDIMTFFYLIFSIQISLLLMKFSVTRLDTIYQTFYTALANVLITVLFHFIEGKELIYLFEEVIAIFVNVVITYIILSLILPILEHFLNIPTVFRLHELNNTDSPVLVRLRSQAIGTYNHSVNVSDMAYNAAKEIGANAELAKVGGLYHDIGKADHPEYFIENQAGGPNIHDEMKYTLSAAVIKSHVKLGVEKGKEVGLPQEVLDIIEQHHGNDIISYFYNKALEEAKASRSNIQVNEEDYRYNADIPQTKEAGIVMLADCFEAASRTLKKPTAQRYEKLFTSILVGKMNGNQLDDCMLSMSEIERIKKVFVHQAFGRDHNRIQYTRESEE